MAAWEEAHWEATVGSEMPRSARLFGHYLR